MPARKRKAKIDSLLLVLVSILIVWGIFTLITTSFAVSLKQFNNTWPYALHQILWGLVPGLLLGAILFKLPSNLLRKWSVVALIINLILVLMVFVPHLGVETGGARRWLQIGRFRFQPSEFLKLTSLLYLSAWFSSNEKRQQKAQGFSKQGLAVFVALAAVLGIGLLLQPDMSTLVVIIIAGLVVYFVAPTPWWHTALLIVALAIASVGLMVFTPYRMARVFTFLHPEADPLGMGYQAKQALISTGSGGLLGIKQGLGLVLKPEEIGFLPFPMSDSIFAVLGKGLGFIGSCLFLGVFLAFIWRGLKTANNASSDFLRLLGVGIITWLGVQTLSHIGGLLGLLPLSGMPLPFFSYGASHLVTELAAVGLLLKGSKK